MDREGSPRDESKMGEGFVKVRNPTIKDSDGHFFHERCNDKEHDMSTIDSCAKKKRLHTHDRPSSGQWRPPHQRKRRDLKAAAAAHGANGTRKITKKHASQHGVVHTHQKKPVLN